MKQQLRNTSAVFVALFLSAATFGQSSNDQTLKRVDLTDPVCILYPSPVAVRSSIPAPKAIRDKIASRSTPCSNFEVTYVGFTPEAQDAFQYAVDIWANSIESPELIRVIANYEDLGTGGTLGSAGPLNIFADAPGVVPEFWYPNALWDKLTGDDPVPNGSDISARFNSNPSVNWYFGLDANPGPGQIDFVSVVLHELAHGLGFIGGQTQVNPIEFSIRLQSGGANPVFYPLIFSNSIVLGDGNNPDSILTLADPSFDLREALTGGELFNDAAAAISGNNGSRPEMHAPATYAQGSTYSHWDEDGFLAGDINSLMTPSISPGEANHNPGPSTLGFFEEMGWTICQTLSTSDFTEEEILISPVPFNNSLEIRLPSQLNFDPLNITIYDITGKVVYQKTEAALNGRIELSNLDQLQAAFYFLRIESSLSNEVITKKIMKN